MTVNLKEIQDVFDSTPDGLDDIGKLCVLLLISSNHLIKSPEETESMSDEEFSEHRRFLLENDLGLCQIGLFDPDLFDQEISETLKTRRNSIVNDIKSVINQIEATS